MSSFRCINELETSQVLSMIYKMLSFKIKILVSFLYRKATRYIISDGICHYFKYTASKLATLLKT